MMKRAYGILIAAAFSLLTLFGCAPAPLEADGYEAADEPTQNIGIINLENEAAMPVCESYGGAAPTVTPAVDGGCDGCTCDAADDGLCVCEICAQSGCDCDGCGGVEEEPDDALPDCCAPGESWSGRPLDG
jgi:hypothetical protein